MHFQSSNRNSKSKDPSQALSCTACSVLSYSIDHNMGVTRSSWLSSMQLITREMWLVRSHTGRAEYASHRNTRNASCEYSSSIFSSIRVYVSSSVRGRDRKAAWRLGSFIHFRRLSIWQTTHRNLHVEVIMRGHASKSWLGN